METRVLITKDGSSTLYSEKFGQFYHNPNGAASESLHVFFKTPGLLVNFEQADSLTILEVGFGTGLNFLLLMDIIKHKNIRIPIKYYSIEAFPIDSETAENFDFSDHLQHPELCNLLPSVFADLKAGINIKKSLAEMDIELHLFVGMFDDFDDKDIKADFIFHDPFSPEVNKNLWSSSVFEKLARFSKESVVLATYCAASKARGAMAAAGWKVARAKGALGKREMTLAALDETKLQGFKRINEERLAERYRTDDF